MSITIQYCDNETLFKNADSSADADLNKILMECMVSQFKPFQCPGYD